MSIQTLMFGYDEPQVAHFTPAAAVHPRSPGEAKTTHSFSLPVNPHTNVTLRLRGSHSPEERLRPLYYAPCVLEGEIMLEADKRANLDALIVSIEGIDQGAGYANAEVGQGIMGEPGEQPTYFWQEKTANLLFLEKSPATSADPNEANEALGSTRDGTYTNDGHRIFPFSITIPETYTPTTTGAPQKKSSLKAKVAPVLHPHRDQPVETQDVEGTGVDDGAALEERPLPRTFLPHDQTSINAETRMNAQYTVSVNVKFASKLTPDVIVHENIVILPLRDEIGETKEESFAPAPGPGADA